MDFFTIMKKQNLEDISLHEYLIKRLHFVSLVSGVDDEYLRNLSAADSHREFGGLTRLAGSGMYESIKLILIRRIFWIFWIQISVQNLRGHVLQYYLQTGWQEIASPGMRITKGNFFLLLKKDTEVLQVTGTANMDQMQFEILVM